jgi:hypothetical protein
MTGSIFPVSSRSLTTSRSAFCAVAMTLPSVLLPVFDSQSPKYRVQDLPAAPSAHDIGAVRLEGARVVGDRPIGVDHDRLAAKEHAVGGVD